MGFLRISGFIHLHDYIKDYARFGSIRILVGINVDALSYELETLGHDPKHQAHKFKRLFHKRQRDTITKKEEYSINVDSSILALTQALQEGKLQIRMVGEKNVHAKFYLFYNEPRPSNKGGYRTEGSLIVGSSNLSENGLKRNIEFNLETKDTDDLLFALSEFNALWKNAIPLEVSDIDSALEGTYLQNVSVEDLYYKLLLEHFGESFLHTDSSIPALFKDYKSFDYQIHAVQEGIEKLMRYHGFFISDVVGLGKTLIASIIAKKLQVDSLILGKILVMSPPALEHSWETHFGNIGIANFKHTSFDSTHKLKDAPSDYELIIIDESHNLRNTNNERYRKVQALCKTPYIHHHTKERCRKKIILLSATPQNNTPQDIKNQIQLFCDSRNSGIEGVENLDEFFSPLTKEFNDLSAQLKDHAITAKKKEQIKKDIERLSNTLRDNLLSKIMIRRTRGDIQSTYAKDMKAQGLKFPKITPPQDLTYDLDDTSFNLAAQTLLLLAQQENTIGSFSYKRYLIYPSLTPEGQKHFREAYGDKKDERFYSDTAERLQVLIQQILFKRFDSSFHAFKATLQAQIRSHTALCEMFSRGEIALPKHYTNREKLYEALESDDESKLADLLEKKAENFIMLSPQHFKSGFFEQVRSDLACLERLLALWEDIDSDPKLECLKAFIKDHSQEKLIIFTEAKATAEYLASKLGDFKLLQVNSHNRDLLERDLRENFDANYDESLQKDTYDIIISTDVLAEGVNLHRSNIIVNYDTPYNATRLMQRIGRINRIGTKFDEVFIYNFKPTKLADMIININQKAFSKIQSFHYTLGEDSAIYDEEEEFDSKSLFAKVEQLSNAQSKETPYKNDLKDLYNTNRARFEAIKALPPKSRCLIELDSHTPQSYTYIKSSKSSGDGAALDTFFPYHIAPSKEQGLFHSEPVAKACDFYQMADFLKSHKSATPLPPQRLNHELLELHYKHIDTALEAMKQSQRTKSQRAQAPMTKSLSKAASKALAMVRSCLELDTHSRAKLINALEHGTSIHLEKDINHIKRDHATALAALAAKLQSPESSPDSESAPLQMINPPQIQLSITAYPSRSKSSTAKHHGDKASSLSDFSGCQGGGEGSLVSLNDQADNADSAKSTKETTPHQKPTPHKG